MDCGQIRAAPGTETSEGNASGGPKQKAPDMRKPGFETCGLPAGLSEQLDGRRLCLLGVRIGKRAVSGCGGRQGIAFFWWLAAAHSLYRLQATGTLPTGCPGNLDDFTVGQRATPYQR